MPRGETLCIIRRNCLCWQRVDVARSCEGCEVEEEEEAKKVLHREKVIIYAGGALW